MSRSSDQPSPLPNPIEHRASPRVGADFPVDVYASGFHGPLSGRTRDLGVGGVCIATPSPFDWKGVSRAVIRLPSGPLDLEAEGAWQNHARGEEVFFTGVRFRNPSDAALEVLLDLVLEAGKQLARFLYRHSDLRGLGLEEAMGLAQVTRLRQVEPGKAIYRQDVMEAGEDSIYIIGSGQVMLQVRVRDARDVPIERLGPGQLFGGLPIVAAVEPGESAIADTSTQLYEINRTAYSYLYRAKPWLAQQLAFEVARAAARRMRSVLARLRDEL